MKVSAGILLFRRNYGSALPPQPNPSPLLQFLLVHPGGPFWAKKDDHAWSIPKGVKEEKSEEKDEVETLEDAARREFYEETGMQFEGSLTALPAVKLSSGKLIHPFLGKGDFDPVLLKSNLFEMEWPPKSGKMTSFPEVDKAAWFDAETSKIKIHKGQVGIIDSALLYLRDEGRSNG